MMRKLYSLAICLVTGLTASAGPVSLEQARSLAQSYLQQGQMTTKHVQRQPETLQLVYQCMPERHAVTQSAGDNVQPLYYVFNRGPKRDGFIIVAGDDRSTPVLGCADKGRFAKDSGNPGFKWWLRTVETNMQRLMALPEESVRIPTASANTNFAPSVAPLVHTQWGQYEPYNNCCPIDPSYNLNCASGCTATAVAQVLGKWKYPLQGEGKVSYVSSNINVKVEEDLSTFVFDWDHMLPAYMGYDDPQECQDAVAKLMYAIGVGMEMNYSAFASSAAMASKKLENHFGIDKGCVTYSRAFFTPMEWNDLMKRELNAARPIVYSGYSQYGGHAFVCDGYNTSGLYHINWGWNGDKDGYFELTALTNSGERPGDFINGELHYNNSQEMICGLQPAGMDNGLPEVQQLYFDRLNIKLGSYSKNAEIPIEILNLMCDNNDFSGSVGIGIYTLDNKPVKMLSVGDMTATEEYIYKKRMSISLANMENGNYKLIPVCKSKDDSEFKPMRGTKHASVCVEVPIRITDDSVEVIDNSDTYTCKLELNAFQMQSPVAYAGVENKISLKLTNHGATYFGPIYLLSRSQGNSILASGHCLLEKGQSCDLNLRAYMPEGITSDTLLVCGTYGLSLGYYENYFIIGGTSVSVTPGAAGDPYITITDATIQNAKDNEVMCQNPIDLNFVVENNGGIWGDKILMYIYPKVGDYIAGNIDSPYILLNKGDKETVHLSYHDANLEEGDYQIYPYIYQDGNYSDINDANGQRVVIPFSVFSFTPEQKGVIDRLQQLKERMDLLQGKSFGSAYGQYAGTSADYLRLSDLCTAYDTLKYSAWKKADWTQAAKDAETISQFVDKARLNVPAEGALFRVCAASAGNLQKRQYLSSCQSADASFVPATAIAQAGDSTIFSYCGKQLVAYPSGFCLTVRDGKVGYAGVVPQGMSFHFTDSSTTASPCMQLCEASGTQGALSLQPDGFVMKSQADSTSNFWIESVESLPVYLGASRYATLYSPVALALPAGLEAYVGDVYDNVIHLNKLNGIIPARTAVVLVGDAGRYLLPVTDAPAFEGNNVLQGTVPALKREGLIYTLQTRGESQGMYRYDGAALSGFKCYVPGQTGVEGYAFSFDSTTGIGTVGTAGSTENYYDLNGRPVLYPSRGVYVTGQGQKVLVP